MILSSKQKYIQVSLNSTLSDAFAVINALPPSDRIIIEAGTPLIKMFGLMAIRQIRDAWEKKLAGTKFFPYVVADLKTMDRATTEVAIAKDAGASAATCLGEAPLETIDSFIESCANRKIDSMIDMMNIEYPTKLLRNLKKLPDIVMIHRGVDEELFNKGKPIPFVQINKVLSTYNVMLSIAGGDSIREVQRAIFNGANIVVVWKEFFHSTNDTSNLASEFLKEVK